MSAAKPSDEVSKLDRGGLMTECNFEKLVKFLDKQLDLDAKLEILDHLDRCENCRDAVYQISRDRDKDLFVYRSFNVEKAAV